MTEFELLVVLVAVWLLDVFVTLFCTVQIGQDLQRMEELYKEITKEGVKT